MFALLGLALPCLEFAVALRGTATQHLIIALQRIGLRWIELPCIALDWGGLGWLWWIGLDCSALNWIGVSLDWIGLEWIGLAWLRLGWVALGCVSFDWVGLG